MVRFIFYFSSFVHVNYTGIILVYCAVDEVGTYILLESLETLETFASLSTPHLPTFFRPCSFPSSFFTVDFADWIMSRAPK